LELNEHGDYEHKNTNLIKSLTKLKSLDLNLPFCVVQLEHLSVAEYDASDVKDLLPLVKLRSLHFNKCPKIVQLGGLQYLPQLENLKLEHCRGDITDLSVLSCCYQLKYLSLSFLTTHPGKYVPNFSSIFGLLELTLSEFPENTDIGALAPLKNLKKLKLRHFYKLKNLQPLQFLKKLTDLRICEFHELVDVSALSKLTSLTELHFYECINLQDVEPLSGLTNLTSLSFFGSRKISNITSLEKIDSLRNFYECFA
jgi:hypothetical protein